MRYYIDDAGTYIFFGSKKDKSFYRIARTTAARMAKGIEVNEDFGLMMDFFEHINLIDFEEHGKVCLIKEDDGISIVALPLGDYPDGIGAALEYMEQMNREKILEMDADKMQTLFDAYLRGEDLLPDEADTKIFKPNISKMLYKDCLYEVGYKDMIRYAPYADYFLKQEGRYYLKAKPGVILDDFLKRANIKEKSTNRVDATLLMGEC